MKKTKKLTLNRETLRRLGDVETSQAAGGLLVTFNAICKSAPCPTEHPVGCGGQTNAHIWC